MNETLIRAYYAAYNTLDADGLARLLAPDVELVSAMGTQTGRDAYLATYRYMTGMFTDVMAPEHITAEGDTITVTIHDSLTAKADIADFMGQSLKAGEELVLRLQGRYTLRDGRIARIAITPLA